MVQNGLTQAAGDGNGGTGGDLGTCHPVRIMGYH